MKFRKKPVVIEATQWFKNGDHPQDNTEPLFGKGGEPFAGEGHVVRFYRHPGVPGQRLHSRCGNAMHNHGWIDTLEGGHIVCPGDWVITGVKGETYPCKPNVFELTYESIAVEESPAETKANGCCPVCNGHGRVMDSAIIDGIGGLEATMTWCKPCNGTGKMHPTVEELNAGRTLL